MAVVYKGALATESREWNYSQDEGMQETRRCHGHPNTVRSWAYNLKDDGYDITISTGGPYWDALAIRTKPYPTSPFVERWTLTTEILDKDLFSHPDVAAQLYAYADGPAAYKKAIEDLASGASTTVPGDATVASWLSRELSRGVQAYEHEYHILNRNVTFDRLYADSLVSPWNMPLTLSSQILKSSTLSTQQSIPPDVMFELPGDSIPDPARRWQYGWRVREQKAEVDTSTTGAFSMSWTYAAWSTFLYTADTT